MNISAHQPSERSQAPPQVAAPGSATESRPGWIISSDDAIRGRLVTLLEGMGSGLAVLPHHDDEGLRKALRAGDSNAPPFIILDVDHDLNWGMSVLRMLRRVHPRVPILIISDDFSKSFGRKILSQGVQFHFSRNFADDEARELLGSVLATKPRKS